MSLFEQLEELLNGNARVGGAPEGEDLPHQHPKRPADEKDKHIYILVNVQELPIFLHNMRPDKRHSSFNLQIIYI